MPEESILTIEPRWPAALALLSIGGLHYALPSELTVGPDWLALVLVAALAIPATISHHRGNWRLSHFGLCCDVGCDSIGRHFPCLTDLAPSRAQGSAGAVVTLGRRPLDLQPVGFRVLVLEAGRRWSAPARLAPLPHGWRILISADGVGPGSSQGNGRGSMAARFRRLPVSRLQHQHRLFAHRCSGAFALGQSPDDAASVHIAGDDRNPRRASCEHTLESHGRPARYAGYGAEEVHDAPPSVALLDVANGKRRRTARRLTIYCDITLLTKSVAGDALAL